MAAEFSVQSCEIEPIDSGSIRSIRDTILGPKRARQDLTQDEWARTSSGDTMYFITDSEEEDWINSIGRSIVQHSLSVADTEAVDYDLKR